MAHPLGVAPGAAPLFLSNQDGRCRRPGVRTGLTAELQSAGIRHSLRSMSPAVAALTALALAAGQDPPKLSPTGSWVVDYAAHSCIATRPYGNGAGGWLVGLEPKPTRDQATVWLTVPMGERDYSDARVSTGGQPVSAPDMHLEGEARDGRRLYGVLLKGDEYSRLQSTGRLRVTNRGNSVDFIVTDIAALGRALNACVSDLLVQWGFSLQQQAELASFPVPKKDIYSYVKSDDYPSSAIARGASGKVDFHLVVGTDGRPKSCFVDRSSGHVDLDGASCQVYLKRARFSPALNNAGHPIEAPYAITLRWSLDLRFA